MGVMFEILVLNHTLTEYNLAVKLLSNSPTSYMCGLDLTVLFVFLNNGCKCECFISKCQ